MSSLSTHAWGTQPEMFGPRHEYRLGIILREVDKLPRGACILDAAVGLGQLAGRMQQAGGPPDAAMRDEMAALGARATSVAKLIAALLIVATLAMAVSRYL